MIKRVLFTALMPIFVLCVVSSAQSKQSTADEPNSVTQKNNEPNSISPDTQKEEKDSATVFHDKCSEIFKEFIDENGLVDYSKLKRKRLKLINLSREFASLESAEYNTWSEKDKIAMWINAYNIHTLKAIIDNYPIKPSRWLSMIYPANSIKQLPGLWEKYKFMIMGEEFTLSEIDSQILRLKFNEPRAFFALSYAAKSSPPLNTKPYYGTSLDEQLDSQMRKFIATGNVYSIDRTDDSVYLSALLQHSWHGTDFVKKYGTNEKFRDQADETRAILNFLSRYLEPNDKNYLEIKSYKIKYFKFDWKLNEQPGK